MSSAVYPSSTGKAPIVIQRITQPNHKGALQRRVIIKQIRKAQPSVAARSGAAPVVVVKRQKPRVSRPSSPVASRPSPPPPQSYPSPVAQQSPVSDDSDGFFSSEGTTVLFLLFSVAGAGVLVYIVLVNINGTYKGETLWDDVVRSIRQDNADHMPMSTFGTIVSCLVFFIVGVVLLIFVIVFRGSPSAIKQSWKEGTMLSKIGKVFAEWRRARSYITPRQTGLPIAPVGLPSTPQTSVQPQTNNVNNDLSTAAIGSSIGNTSSKQNRHNNNKSLVLTVESLNKEENMTPNANDILKQKIDEYTKKMNTLPTWEELAAFNDVDTKLYNQKQNTTSLIEMFKKDVNNYKTEKNIAGIKRKVAEYLHHGYFKQIFDYYDTPAHDNLNNFKTYYDGLANIKPPRHF